MNQESAKSLTGFAAILIVVGIVVMSPMAGILCAVLSLIVSAVPFVFARGALRITAAFILLLAVLLSIVTFPKAKHERDLINTRAMKKAQ